MTHTRTHTHRTSSWELSVRIHSAVFSGNLPVLGNPQQLGEGGASPAETQHWQGGMRGLDDDTPA